MATAATPDVDLTDFFKLSQPKKPPCPIGFIRDKLTDAERAQLAAACDQPNEIITNKAIIGWIQQRDAPDIPISVQAVMSHRAESCTCFKPS